MSETNTMTVAEGLSEIKRIVKLLPMRNTNISEYCAKRKGAPDDIDNQREYVNSQRQSAEDLIKRMVAVKIAIMKSNLDTTVTWKDNTMSVAEAILFKSNVGGRLTSTRRLYAQLYASFSTDNAEYAIEQYARLKGYAIARMDEAERSKAELVIERYYNEREIQGKLEELIGLESMLDALIDSCNHKTTITV